MSSCCHSLSAKPSEQALLCYLWFCSKHHLCSSTLPKSHCIPATEGTAEILFCPPSKGYHQPADEQRIEYVSQENSRMQQGFNHRERGVGKRVQNVAGGYWQYIPSSHLTSIPKNEYWFPKPRNWVIGSPFGAGRPHKNYSLDFLLLSTATGHGLQKTREWYRRFLSLCWSPVPVFPQLSHHPLRGKKCPQQIVFSPSIWERLTKH